jgi:hypothetical protein
MGVLDGTGTYLDATGTGLFTGSRTAAVGQPVRASFTLAVHTAK